MSAASTLPAYSMNRANFPEMYERSLVQPLFRPFAEVLLDQAALAPDARVLDVACGTGIVARLACERLGATGRVVGVDVSAPMLEVARRIEPRIDWRVGDAAALPVGADEKFDVVASQQGLQFFGDRAASAREMRRVLAPGGTLFVATWRSAEEMPPLLDLQRVAERHVGAIVDQRYSFGDERALERLLLDAGFRDVRVVTLALTTRFANGAEFVRMNAMALVGMSGAQLGDAERERLLASIVEESAEAVRSYTDGATLAFEMCTNVAVAR